MQLHAKAAGLRRFGLVGLNVRMVSIALGVVAGLVRELRQRNDSPQTKIKMKTITKRILLTVGLAGGLVLSSCVSPYDTGVTTSTEVTTYRPGYTTRTLPGGYRSETIAGSNYYYHNGAYYQRRADNYVVVQAPRRSQYYNEYTQYGNRTVINRADGSTQVINRLPSGYTTVDYQGEPYYRHQNSYYRRQGSGYVTVASPF